MSEASLRDRLNRLLGGAVAAGDVPGLAALVTDARADRYVGAFGERRLGGGVPMTPDTVGWIASMTKPLTTAAVLQQVEAGMLDLDAPAQRWLPALAELQVLEGFDAAGKPRLRPPRKAPTLHQLLTHTGGFGYEFWSAGIQRCMAQFPPRGTAGREHRYFGFPLLADPGECWNYGVGIDWAGRVVEAATGMRLGAWIAQHLTGPLGMHDTRFGVAPDSRGRRAAMHQRGADGALAATDAAPSEAPEWDMGGGGMYGTVADYGHFVRMILNRGHHEGRTILQPSSVDLMCSNQISSHRVAPLRAAMPEVTNDAEFFPGVAKAWTLGFQINLEAAPTGRPAGGLMWAGLANSYFWIDPVNGLGGVYLTQLFPFADTKALGLYLAFERAVYDELAGSA